MAQPQSKKPKQSESEEYPDADRRRDEALKRALKMPPKPKEAPPKKRKTKKK